MSRVENPVKLTTNNDLRKYVSIPYAELAIDSQRGKPVDTRSTR